MNRNELVRLVSHVLRENNIKKSIYAQKHVFHISDDDGNTKDFVIKKNDTEIIFTLEDIDAIISACIYVIEDALKHGDQVSIRGFGSIGLHHRKARVTKHPVTGEVVDVQARYVPKFVAGSNLKLCAKVYELSKDDESPNRWISSYDEDGE